jgi:hypothetical protein
MKLEFSRHIFGEKKKPKYQTSSKSVQWERSCSTRTDRQADKHDETNSSLPQFCERYLYGLRHGSTPGDAQEVINEDETNKCVARAK